MAGEYSANLTQSTECLRCPDGRFSTGSTSSCSVCVAGRFGDSRIAKSSSSHCMPCPSGQYQTTDGQMTCPVCPTGRFQPAVAQTFCEIQSQCAASSRCHRTRLAPQIECAWTYRRVFRCQQCAGLSPVPEWHVSTSSWAALLHHQPAL